MYPALLISYNISSKGHTCEERLELEDVLTAEAKPEACLGTLEKTSMLNRLIPEDLLTTEAKSEALLGIDIKRRSEVGS